jgi:uncharacterized protein (DUF885 family)
MKSPLHVSLCLLAALLPATLASAADAPNAPATSTPAASTPAAQLRALFKDSDEASLKRNPLNALARGDLRYADQFGDGITDAYLAAEKRAASRELAALARIGRDHLNDDDRVSYDVFEYRRRMALKAFEPALLEADVVRPIDHFNGVQSFVPDMSSGEGIAPFKTLADYENNLRRLDGYILYLDRAIGRMREGLAAGVTNPKLVMANVVTQLDALIAEGIDKSTFYRPVLSFPDGIAAADRARITAAYREYIRARLIPAHRRLRDFIQNEYLPRARSSVGLGQMPGGAALYQYLATSYTTTDMTPAAIHALGWRASWPRWRR